MTRKQVQDEWNIVASELETRDYDAFWRHVTFPFEFDLVVQGIAANVYVVELGNERDHIDIGVELNIYAPEKNYWHESNIVIYKK